MEEFLAPCTDVTYNLAVPLLCNVTKREAPPSQAMYCKLPWDFITMHPSRHNVLLPGLDECSHVSFHTESCCKDHSALSL